MHNVVQQSVNNFVQENNLAAILSGSFWANIAIGNYLLDVGLGLEDNFSKENNLRNAVSFPYNIVFFSVLAQDFSCAIWLNLNNVEAAFAATSYYQKITGLK